MRKRLLAITMIVGFGMVACTDPADEIVVEKPMIPQQEATDGNSQDPPSPPPPPPPPGD